MLDGEEGPLGERLIGVLVEHLFEHMSHAAGEEVEVDLLVRTHHAVDDRPVGLLALPHTRVVAQLEESLHQAGNLQQSRDVLLRASSDVREDPQRLAHSLLLAVFDERDLKVRGNGVTRELSAG
jgi:hypothetical protein